MLKVMDVAEVRSSEDSFPSAVVRYSSSTRRSSLHTARVYIADEVKDEVLHLTNELEAMIFSYMKKLG